MPEGERENGARNVYNLGPDLDTPLKVTKTNETKTNHIHPDDNFVYFGT